MGLGGKNAHQRWEDPHQHLGAAGRQAGAKGAGAKPPDEVGQAGPAQVIQGLAGHIENSTLYPKGNGKL